MTSRLPKRRRREDPGFLSPVPSLVMSSCLGALLLLAVPARADVGSLMRRGNGLYSREDYEGALEAYEQAEVIEPDATAIHFNLGNTLYRLGRYPEAMRELELVMTDEHPRRRADAMYNIGNTFFESGQLDGAIRAYTAALVTNPDDRDAKQNLEFCLQKKREVEQQPDSSKQDEQQQRQQQQQQEQQQQGPQPRPDQMGPDQAERVLQALESREKDEQRKAHRADRRRNVEKDW